MDLKWSNGISYKDLFLSLIKYAPNNQNIHIASKFNNKLTKFFKSGDNDICTFESALEQLGSCNKMVDLVGGGDSSDLYFPSDIIEMIDKDLKKTSAILADDHLIVDFENYHGIDHKPIGMKVFEIYDYDSEENKKEDMVRRSKY